MNDIMIGSLLTLALIAITVLLWVAAGDPGPGTTPQAKETPQTDPESWLPPPADGPGRAP